MKQMRLKNLFVGQSFTMCRIATRFTKIYKVVSINDVGYLCMEYGSQCIRLFNKDIVVFLQFVNVVDVAFQSTNEFVEYLNRHNHLVLIVNYGYTDLMDEVIYL